MNFDSSLVRLNAYAGTLEPGELKNDLMAALEWIHYAKPLLGAVTPSLGHEQNYASAQAMNPFIRHGLGLDQRQQKINEIATALSNVQEALDKSPPKDEEPEPAA